tara:strand:- start:28835 stop:29065 length:231 start_codon:yes stop_codon:yes gene_type:complete
MSEKNNYEERATKALESIADSFQTIEDSVLDVDFPMWSERLEWYLNEFFKIAQQRTIGSSNRPTVDRERNIDETKE